MIAHTYHFFCASNTVTLRVQRWSMIDPGHLKVECWRQWCIWPVRAIWNAWPPLLRQRCHSSFIVRMKMHSLFTLCVLVCVSYMLRRGVTEHHCMCPHLWLCAAGLSFSPPLLRFLCSSLTPFRVWEIKAATAYLKYLTCSEPCQVWG